MFFKLLKYEFKSTSKWYFLLYLITLLSAFSLSFWRIKASYPSELATEDLFSNHLLTPSQLLFFMFVFASVIFIMGTLFVSTLLLVIRRFRQTIFGPEAYLTLTLPVSSHQLILSKLVAAILWCCASSLTLLLACWLIYLPTTGLSQNLTAPSTLLNSEMIVQYFLPAFSYLLIFYLMRILFIYAAISLSHYLKNFKLLGALMYYFLIELSLDLTKSFFISKALGEYFSTLNNQIALLTALNWHHQGLQLIVFVIFGGVAYWITHHTITHHLNLD